MTAAGVPTARAWPVSGPAELETALDEVARLDPVPRTWSRTTGWPRARGCSSRRNRAAAVAHGRAVLDAGGAILVEEYLDGQEISLFAITDGTTVLSLDRAQDFENVGTTATRGPNTGGMWAPQRRCPGRRRAWWTTCWPPLSCEPTVDEIARRGEAFSGLLPPGWR